MPTVAGIDDHGVEAQRVLDIGRPDDGFEKFGQINPRYEDGAIALGRRQTEAKFDVVDEDVLSIGGEFDHHRLGSEKGIPSFPLEAGEAVKSFDFFEPDVIMPVFLENFPRKSRRWRLGMCPGHRGHAKHWKGKMGQPSPPGVRQRGGRSRI